jgi:hypothetical protein
VPLWLAYAPAPRPPTSHAPSDGQAGAATADTADSQAGAATADIADGQAGAATAEIAGGYAEAATADSVRVPSPPSATAALAVTRW